jgi:hypothetical protein
MSHLTMFLGVFLVVPATSQLMTIVIHRPLALLAITKWLLLVQLVQSVDTPPRKGIKRCKIVSLAPLENLVILLGRVLAKIVLRESISYPLTSARCVLLASSLPNQE